MIISHGRRYLFVHIPKTGGTSMALALENRAKADDILIGDTPKAVKRKHRLKTVKTAGRLWKHSTLADVDGLITPDQMADLFTFTLVRNPWDRMVSYYHWLQTQTFQHPAVTLSRTCNFSGFLNAPLTRRTFQAAPFRHYMTDAHGQCHADLYIRLEHLETDLRPLTAHLGFDLELPRANSSRRARDWRPFYSDADADLLAEICSMDVEAHGYAFDPA